MNRITKIRTPPFYNLPPPMNKLQTLKDKIYDNCEDLSKRTSLFGREFRLIYGDGKITPTHILRCLGPDYAIGGEGYLYLQDEFGSYNSIEIEYYDGDKENFYPKLDLSNFNIDSLDEETIDFLLDNIK